MPYISSKPAVLPSENPLNTAQEFIDYASTPKVIGICNSILKKYCGLYPECSHTIMSYAEDLIQHTLAYMVKVIRRSSFDTLAMQMSYFYKSFHKNIKDFIFKELHRTGLRKDNTQQIMGHTYDRQSISPETFANVSSHLPHLSNACSTDVKGNEVDIFTAARKRLILGLRASGHTYVEIFEKINIHSDSIPGFGVGRWYESEGEKPFDGDFDLSCTEGRKSAKHNISDDLNRIKTRLTRICA